MHQHKNRGKTYVNDLSDSHLNQEHSLRDQMVIIRRDQYTLKTQTLKIRTFDGTASNGRLISSEIIKMNNK